MTNLHGIFTQPGTHATSRPQNDVSVNYVRVDRPVSLRNYAVTPYEKGKVLAKFRKPAERASEALPALRRRFDTYRVEGSDEQATRPKIDAAVKLPERTRTMLNAAIEGRRKYPELAEQTLAKLLGRQSDDPLLAGMMRHVVSDWESALRGESVYQPRKIEVLTELCGRLADPETRHIATDYLRPAVVDFRGHGGKPPIVKKRPEKASIRPPAGMEEWQFRKSTRGESPESAGRQPRMVSGTIPGTYRRSDT